MRYRPFGRTGLRVSEFVLGTTAIRNKDEYRRILDIFADAGGNFVDTAWAQDSSEEMLGEVVRKRDRLVLGTRHTLTPDPADAGTAGGHRKSLILSLERSLRRLRTDYVDVFWVDVADRGTPIEETLQALDDVVGCGKVLHTGIIDAPAWTVAQANTLAECQGWTPFSGVQVPYNLLRRDIERETLPMAESFGVSVTVASPLEHGVLAGAADAPDRGPRGQAAAAAVAEVAGDLGVPPAQVALAWTRHRSPSVLPIVGVDSADQLVANLGAWQVELPSDAVARLEAAVSSGGEVPAEPTAR
ncbi:aldo/keto reductase [Nocardia sp. NPDC024068]|uniref:aldo/keto reductase n=1 Tax=Nocardia sp. NPDC024068 TaxID=3157197 RepID=UPI0033FD92C2